MAIKKYVVINKDPNSQLDFPSKVHIETVKIDSTYNVISKWGKLSVMSLSIAHPTKTVTGTTKREIWVQEPTATIFRKKVGNS
jgi:hypothetical protein